MAYTAPNLSLAVWDQFEDVFDHTELAANWQSVDNHNHTGAPKGLQIPSGGLEAGSVRTVDLHDGAVTTIKVGDGQITNIKIADLDASKLTGVLPVSLLDASTLAQTGDLKPIAHSSPSNGWLLCDGTAISRATYSALFAKIGLVYGVGNGSTTFNIPDLRGRVPVGVDGAANRLLANDTIGKVGGEERHTLAMAELAVHSHGGTTGVENSSLAHGHGFSGGSTGGQTVTTGAGGTSAQIVGGGGLFALRDIGINGPPAHNHNFTTGDQGSGTPFNVMQPYQIVNWAIKV